MKRLLHLVLLSLGLLLIHLTPIHAQLSKEDLRRMERMRPRSPFDLSGDYRLLEAWRIRANQDSSTTKTPWYFDALLGKLIPLGTSKWTLGIDGLSAVYLGHNEFEGATFGYEVFLSKDFSLGHRLVLRSANNWASKSKQYLGNHRALLFYAPTRSGLAVLDFGITSGATTHISNDETFAENFLSPLGTNNQLYDFRKHYISLRNSIYLIPQLRTDLLALYEYRQAHARPTHADHQLLLTELRLSFDFARPMPLDGQFPSAYNLPHGFFAPEVSVMYRTAIDPSAGKARKSFHRYEVLGLSLRSSYAFNDYRRLDWGIVGERFLSRKLTSDYDVLSLPMGGTADRLPISSTWLTGEHVRLNSGAWLWGLLNYGGGRMALAHIPLLKRYQLDEQIHLKAMYRSQGRPWFEFGYSLGLGRMIRLGLAYGDDFHGKNAFALKLSLPFLYLTSLSSTRY